MCVSLKFGIGGPGFAGENRKKQRTTPTSENHRKTKFRPRKSQRTPKNSNAKTQFRLVLEEPDDPARRRKPAGWDVNPARSSPHCLGHPTGPLENAMKSKTVASDLGHPTGSPHWARPKLPPCWVTLLGGPIMVPLGHPTGSAPNCPPTGSPYWVIAPGSPSGKSPHWMSQLDEPNNVQNRMKNPRTY